VCRVVLGSAEVFLWEWSRFALLGSENMLLDIPRRGRGRVLLLIRCPVIRRVIKRGRVRLGCGGFRGVWGSEL